MQNPIICAPLKMAPGHTLLCTPLVTPLVYPSLLLLRGNFQAHFLVALKLTATHNTRQNSYPISPLLGTVTTQ